MLYRSVGWDLTRPVSVIGIFNERCNYRCRYCKFWRKESYDPELPVEDWIEALRSLRAFAGRYLIRFGGGEPFLRPGFLEVVEACRAHGIDWNVCTNGSLLDAETVRRVVAAGPFNIDVSVDSPDARVHDSLRGCPGSLEAVEQGIARLREERERTGRRFPIRLKPVITNRNFRQLPALVDWCAEVGADTIDPQPVHPFSKEVERELWIRDPAKQEELTRIVHELVQRKQEGAPIESSPEVLLSLPGYFRGATPPPNGTPRCEVGLREYHIRTNGEVQVCWMIPPLGDVRRQSAHTIWRGPQGRSRRRETEACPRRGSADCAISCLRKRTLREELTRGLLFLGHLGVLPRGKRHTAPPARNPRP